MAIRRNTIEVMCLNCNHRMNVPIGKGERFGDVELNGPVGIINEAGEMEQYVNCSVCGETSSIRRTYPLPRARRNLRR